MSAFNAVVADPSYKQRTTEKKTCPECGKEIHKKRFSAHIKTHKKKVTDIDQNRYHHTVLVDETKGVFCSTINLTGTSYPIHVIKRTAGNTKESFCEHQQCVDMKETAKRGGNLSFECPHVRSVLYASRGKAIELQASKLLQMRDSKFVTEERHDELLNLLESNSGNDSPLLVQIPSMENHSSRFMYLSVKTNTQRYWSRIGRVIVAYDTLQNTFTCKCSASKRYCIHKAVGKWCVYQEMPECFSSEAGGSIVTDCNTEESVPEITKESNVAIEYLRNNKKIPVDIPKQVIPLYKQSVFKSTKKIIPKEMECHQCSGPLATEITSQRSKIVTMTMMIRGKLKLCQLGRIIYIY